MIREAVHVQKIKSPEMIRKGSAQDPEVMKRGDVHVMLTKENAHVQEKRDEVIVKESVVDRGIGKI